MRVVAAFVFFIAFMIFPLSGIMQDRQGKKLIPRHKVIPFQKGEYLKYKVQYNLYMNVNVGKLETEIETDQSTIKGGEHCHKIAVKGRTFGFYDPFYKVRDYYESCVQWPEIIPERFIRDISEGSYKRFDKIYFNHDQQKAIDQDEDVYNIPDNVQDMVSVLYYIRSFDLRKASKGDSMMLNTFITDTTYRVGLKHKGKEKIRTSFGKIRCLKLQPILVVGRVFDSKHGMTLWVTDDKNQIPVKIKSGISVGAIQGQLTEYENLKYPFMGND